MSRLEGAIDAILQAVACASEISLDQIGRDADFADELGLDNLALISLSLIIEEIFSIACPDSLFASPRHRCASSLAEWAIRQADQSAWLLSRQCQRRA